MTNSEVLQQLERGYRHPKPQNTPDQMYEVMKNCWNHDPEKRPTFEFLYTVMEDFNTFTQNEYQENNDF